MNRFGANVADWLKQKSLCGQVSDLWADLSSLCDKECLCFADGMLRLKLVMILCNIIKFIKLVIYMQYNHIAVWL